MSSAASFISTIYFDTTIYVVVGLCVSFIVVTWIWLRSKYRGPCFLDFIRSRAYARRQTSDSDVRLPPIGMRKAPPVSLPDAIKKLSKLEKYHPVAGGTPLYNISGGISTEPRFKWQDASRDLIRPSTPKPEIRYGNAVTVPMTSDFKNLHKPISPSLYDYWTSSNGLVDQGACGIEDNLKLLHQSGSGNQNNNEKSPDRTIDMNNNVVLCNDKTDMNQEFNSTSMSNGISPCNMDGAMEPKPPCLLNM